MAPPPPGNSWRGGAKSQPAAGPTRPKAAGWSAKPDRDYQRSVLRYRLKVGLWSLLFFSLVVTLFVILIYWPVRTPFLVLAVTDYDSPLPPNAWVREDLQRLHAAGRRDAPEKREANHRLLRGPVGVGRTGREAASKEGRRSRRLAGRPEQGSRPDLREHARGGQRQGRAVPDSARGIAADRQRLAPPRRSLEPPVQGKGRRPS